MYLKKITGAQPFFFNKKKITNDFNNIIKSGELSNGIYSEKFEQLFNKTIDTKFSVSVNSGGTALEIALESLNIKNKEVIVPTQTFIASANSVVRAGGMPVFCDIDKKTGCANLETIKKKITKKTAGVVFVYMFGIIPYSILEIKRFCKKNNIFLLEDAAHAHGASIKGHKAGSIGDISTFSFYSTKILTSGEGGIISTNNKKLYEKCKIIRNHGKDLRKNLFIYPGNNFRLSEIQCMLAYHQLRFIKKFINHRNKIAKIYYQNLKNCKFLEFVQLHPKATNSFWRYPLYLLKKNRIKLQKALLNRHNIRITWMYEPLCHQQPIYKKIKQKKLLVAEKAIKQLLNLPTHYSVNEKDAKKISQNLLKEINNI